MADLAKSAPFICPNCGAEVYAKWTFILLILSLEPFVWLIILLFAFAALALGRYLPGVVVVAILVAGAILWIVATKLLWPLGVKKDNAKRGDAPAMRPSGGRTGSLPTRPS
ncbi:hypothetical protein [Nitrospirillum iridis]|uniref:Type VI protein secretion system component VasK n=1 Tax=Nitrospirillum iridis TaxID=765888 RepID=A0A7X0AWX0_9PROT|nr:hypothetical protein [Nitrospirillum iridis]MBB6251222.1 type VI protein secretion system component VasK [Nitrospirillum iridis]